MKRIFLLLALVFTGAAAFTQQTPVIDSVIVVKQKQHGAAWACPACFKITKEGGQCTADKTPTIQLGTYYCQHCVKASGDKPGNCSTCKGATTQMTRRLCKEHTGNIKKTA